MDNTGKFYKVTLSMVIGNILTDSEEIEFRSKINEYLTDHGIKIYKMNLDIKEN